MASKLFHAVVGFGIALGSTTVGCAAPSGDETSTTEAAQVAAPAPVKDRFCEVAWPTTKGGPRPEQAQDCIDPDRTCGDYPGEIFDYPQCARVDEETNACNLERPRVWLFCKEETKGHRWACPAGTVLESACDATAGASP